MQVQAMSREDPLEQEMATHTSTLAWEISWTEKPGRLLSMGMQKVGHDLVTKPIPPPQECHILVKETGTKGRHVMRKISGKTLPGS